ncbi:MAG: hypothetical protein D6765_06345 [Bacteroidetes bacterium]|nr:MAG: hypothetical protein D6765_06345 [Bacteroidota bacterium]
MRTFRRLRFKCFLRVDQIESRNVTNFPDASKLLAEKMELLWRPRDLYNLLWHHLLNLSANGQGEAFFTQNGYRVPVPPDSSSPISVPDSLKRSEEEQRKLFHTITGPWMGRDHRRGFPYTWIINHLGDAKGQVSPRSFLAALREAAADTQENHPDHPFALHYNSIKRGVQKASIIRVDELAEDYPWIITLMKPLEGLVVPVEFEEIKRRWTEERTLETLTSGNRLPPEHLGEGPEGVRKDLERIGIFQRMKDGRVNIPDLYRVGFKMGRRGGVRPVSRN